MRGRKTSQVSSGYLFHLCLRVKISAIELQYYTCVIPITPHAGIFISLESRKIYFQLTCAREIRPSKT